MRLTGFSPNVASVAYDGGLLLPLPTSSSPSSSPLPSSSSFLSAGLVNKELGALNNEVPVLPKSEPPVVVAVLLSPNRLPPKMPPVVVDGVVNEKPPAPNRLPPVVVFPNRDPPVDVPPNSDPAGAVVPPNSEPVVVAPPKRLVVGFYSSFFSSPSFGFSLLSSGFAGLGPSKLAFSCSLPYAEGAVAGAFLLTLTILNVS